MVPSGHKTLVHYPDGTSKVITLYVRPLVGQIIAHGWEVTKGPVRRNRAGGDTPFVPPLAGRPIGRSRAGGLG